MFITNPERLRRFRAENRIWQGIPGIEVTKKGRTFLCFYSGGTKEQIGNYALLVKSEDGVCFSEPIAAAWQEGHRCFDPCLWIDPLGRLWFFWAFCPDDMVYAAICDDPDAEALVWGDPFPIGHNVMLNKPIVTSTGVWLFPLAVWRDGVRALSPEFDDREQEKGSFVYASYDNGRTFRRLGCADVRARSFDEHMVVERRDGSLAMYVRTDYGIGGSLSYDGGKSWTGDFDTGLGGPSSRFFIGRLASGRLLLINHRDFHRRNNLTAMLSEDDGQSWPYSLLLDRRSQVSYPDAAQTEDGVIHVTYDRERGAFKSSLETALGCAREILTASITEEDIMAGTLCSKGSYLRRAAVKLGEYSGEQANPFGELRRCDDAALCEKLLQSEPMEAVTELFDLYPVNCANLQSAAAEKLDAAISEFLSDATRPALLNIIRAIRSASDDPVTTQQAISEEARSYIAAHLEEEDLISGISGALHLSSQYLQHVFKRTTGTTILKYRNEVRMARARKLLISSALSVTEIAAACGFNNSSYFTKIFRQEIGLTPSDFRRVHQT